MIDQESPAAHLRVPRLNIAILVCGTRGDVQPFIIIGQLLQSHGHRVRLATHNLYEDYVIESGLEFYPLAGDPKV
jgi:sterol 3beta-glucosyltransferase